VHFEKRRVNLTKLWSWQPQLHLSGHLRVVVKERAHKCNPYVYFNPISISDLNKESIARSRFSVSGNYIGGEEMLKVVAGVEVQLATCSCTIIASPSHLKPRKLTLIGLMGFLSSDL